MFELLKIIEGMRPVKLLAPKSKSFRFCRLPISCGISPAIMCKTKLKYEFKCFMYIQKELQLETWVKFSQVENQASLNGVGLISIIIENFMQNYSPKLYIS